MKDNILKILEDIKPDLLEINDFMYHNPELGDQEYKAVEKLTELLAFHGFKVEKGILGKPTAFKAVYDSVKPGSAIAYLCEYDALPEVGHGCGHNLIGTMSAGAGIALSKQLAETGGKVVVFGTPAEETNGAKVDMAEKGAFEGIDAAMILHPSDKSYESGTSLAMDALEFAFQGKACHAASEPEAGINALDAVNLTFAGINALRQHVTSDVRIHGIVSEGGVAANIVPDRASARFYVRAAKRSYLSEIVEKVKNVARGAALMTGAKLEISNYEISYDNMNTNRVLSELFTANLRKLGVDDIEPHPSASGSIDMGNVSHVVPSIHPYIGLGCPGLPGHTKEMAKMTITESAHVALIKGAAALAMTGYDVLKNKDIQERIKKEFMEAK
ncbi:MAG: M20 family metallopeptidase [Bacillota bacterium]